VRSFGLPQDFLPQGSRSTLLEGLGLTAPVITREVKETLAGLVRSTPRPTLRRA
jgi:deoxyxylulose-5-phosphate synthase